jgi:hypothetical protein
MAEHAGGSPENIEKADVDQNIVDAERALRDVPPGVEFSADLVDAIFISQTRITRVALVPSYRHEVLLGRRRQSYSTYLLLASGRGVTGFKGEAVINIDDVLAPVKQGRPMHWGMSIDPTDNDNTVIPPLPVMTGAPVTVVTGRDSAPALFTATNEDEVDGPDPDSNQLHYAWHHNVGSRNNNNSATSVRIRSFKTDGTALPQSSFNWHMSVEIHFRLDLPG